MDLVLSMQRSRSLHSPKCDDLKEIFELNELENLRRTGLKGEGTLLHPSSLEHAIYYSKSYLIIDASVSL